MTQDGDQKAYLASNENDIDVLISDIETDSLNDSETDPLMDATEDIEEDYIVEREHVLSLSEIGREACQIMILAFPVIVGYLLHFSLSLSTVFIVGHIGTTELAASALSSMWCNVTGYSIGMGMSSALDTLCAQSFTGSNDKFALGKHLQRGIVVVTALCIPISLIWIFTEPLLILLGQDAHVAKLSAQFVLIMLPGLFPNLVYDCIERYLQAQGIMSASLHISMFSAPFNVLLQWLLVWSPTPFKIGVMGAPLASSITNWLMMLLLIFYATSIKGYQVWGGWEWKEALNLSQIHTFLKLGIPGTFMLCAEWWALEIVALAAGLLGSEMLAAQTIVLNTCSLAYMIPLGISAAASNRIGNLLGSNLPRKSKLAAIVSLCIGLVSSLVLSIALFSLRRVWGSFWTSEVNVIKLVDEIIPLAALFQIADGMSGVGSGIMLGSGRQKLGAIILFTGYYCLGLPSGIFAAFYLHYGLQGIWVGLTGSLFLMAFLEFILILQTDWRKEAHRALTLVNNDSFPEI